MNRDGILVLQGAAATFAFDGLLKFLEFLMGITPCFLAEGVKCFICPPHDVEGVHTAGTVRKVLLNALVDSSRTIAGHNFYGCTLLRSKAFQKLGKDILTVLIAGPDDGVGIVIHNDRYVLMSFPIAGLVNADVDKVIQPFRMVRLNALPSSGDASSDCLPVDPQVFSNGAAAEVPGHPGGGQIEALRKAGIVERPRNCGDQDAMLRAVDSLSAGFDIHQNTGEIQRSPAHWICHRQHSACHRSDSGRTPASLDAYG